MKGATWSQPGPKLASPSEIKALQSQNVYNIFVMHAIFLKKKKKKLIFEQTTHNKCTKNSGHGATECYMWF